MKRRFKSLSALLMVGVFMLPFMASATNSEQPAKSTQKSVVAEEKRVVKNKDSISVPGYAWMNFVADKKEQTTPLRNPIQNDCYFKITIVLEDGTEIWKSDYMKPGEKAEHITLSQALPEGTYENVTIKYDCFSLRNKASLNNARIKLKLVVKK